jgi:hypothetical protein
VTVAALFSPYLMERYYMAATRQSGPLGQDPLAFFERQDFASRFEREETPAPPRSSYPGVTGLVESAQRVFDAIALTLVPEARTAAEANRILDERWKQIQEEEQREFDLLGKYGVLGTAKGKALDTLDKYLEYRESYYGWRESYLKFAAESDAEFDKHIKVMTVSIHAPDPARGLSADRKIEAQKLLYRWVRKAYKDADPNLDVGEHVRANWEFSTVLYSEADQIRAKSGESFIRGGFVVRPEVVNTLRLGTISKHSEAEAVDVDWEDNPQFPDAAETWRFIEDFVGMKVVKDEARWKSDPLGLARDVQALSDEFKSKVAAEVKRWQEIIQWAYAIQLQFKLEADVAARRGEAEGRCIPPDEPPIMAELRRRLAPVKGPQWTKPGSPASGFKPHPNDPAWIAWEKLPELEKRFPNGIPQSISESEAYDIIFEKLKGGKNNTLIRKGYAKRGFMTLSPKVIEQFHKHGFKWGVTFPTPDLMHFVKPKPPQAQP